ncbi:glycosyltransferase family 61 protein [Pontibacter silvestris]|uniref:Glycosyltransferase family 61 protein n=1 Tax=Pontibacter silvestris TaxID=2305183 RepID=A0ABW4X1T6_9BACT|nr:glycosyltransferase family 61 protein [Pontibacter silvestris]MCC9135061.1 glycosyltransferase family 61 protein [Pontibacter silvestris]
MINKNLLKLKRKVKDVIRRTIRHNYHLKPCGFYRTSKEYIDNTYFKESVYTEITPEETTYLPLPEELFNTLNDYANPDAKSNSRKNTLVSKTKNTMLSLPKGRLYTNNIDCIAVIGPDNKLIADVSFQFSEVRVTEPYENKVFELSYFDKPTYYPGIAFSMLSGGGAAVNYAHWFVDAFPRLHLLKESGLFDKVNWFIVPAYKYDYHIDSLKMLGIEADKIVVADNYTHLQADTLIVTSHPRGLRNVTAPKWITDFHRNTFLPAKGKSNKSAKRIYISRQDSSLRKVTNEEEVIEMLSKYGFETYVLSKLSFQEKIDLFSSADVIVATMGAGSFNYAFANKETTIIEMFSQSFVQHLYYSLAHAAGVTYHPIIFKAEKVAQRFKDGHVDDITVDIKELERLVHRVITQESAKEEPNLLNTI